MANKIKVFTDSTADLSPDLLERYNISVIPLYVIFGEKSYRDGIDMTTRELYENVNASQMLPKTSAPTVNDFAEAFRPWIEDGYSVIYIGLSSKLSSTTQSAYMAAQEFPEGRVAVIDSLNLSTGIGLLVLYTAELILKGLDFQEIVRQVQEAVPKVRSSFIIDTLKYLHMGGRCSSIQFLAGSVLRLRPQILVIDGKMTVGEKYRGSRKHCLDRFFDDWVGDGANVHPHRVFVTHSACSPEDVEYLRDKVQKAVQADEVLVTEAGTVISSHCGPGTIGILYLIK